MAEKISTLILKVDLECYRCRKEILRILCKLQDKENIRTISYEEKSNTVIISGPFDPQKLSKKLRWKAGKVIKDIQIKEVKEKEKEKEKPKEIKPVEPAPKEKEKPKETKPVESGKEKPKPSESPKEEKKPKKDEKPAEPEKKPEKEEKPKPVEPEKKPEPAKNEPVQVSPQPVCCPAPYYEGYYGGCRCCACGRIGPVVGPTYGSYGPGPYGPYDGYRVYHFFSDEDPSTSSCYIM